MHKVIADQADRRAELARLTSRLADKEQQLMVLVEDRKTVVDDLTSRLAECEKELKRCEEENTSLRKENTLLISHPSQLRAALERKET